jgi:hypothetical protein
MIGDFLWVAHASRLRELFLRPTDTGEACFGETPKPTREVRDGLGYQPTELRVNL